MTQPYEPPKVTEIPKENVLVMNLAKQVQASIGVDGKPEEVLKWLADQPKDIVRSAIKNTQPKGWAVASEPLIDSLSDDQCVGILAAMMAVYVQTL